MALRLDYITDRLGGELHGEPAQIIESLAPLEFAGPGQISFLSHPKFRSLLEGSRAACVIVGPDMAQAALVRGACIIADQPYLYYARLTQLWKREHSPPQGPRIHPSAVVDPHAHVDSTAQVGALSVIERGAVVGAGTVIRARVSIGENCRIGERCVIHSGAVIGADGFGYVRGPDGYVQFPQIGTVIIENDVEIGAGSCVDRGALGETRIGEGTKIDNLVQIAHNVTIGKRVVIAAQTGISGSTEIEDDCVIGGQVGMGDHARVLSGAVIGSQAGVLPGKIVRPGVWWGTPVQPLEEYKRQNALVKGLGRLREEVKELKKKLV